MEIYNYVMQCTFSDNATVRVVSACGATHLEAFHTAIRLFGGRGGCAILMAVISKELVA